MPAIETSPSADHSRSHSPSHFPGVTIPLGTPPLVEQRALIEELPSLGYTDVWSAESDGYDGFTSLALTSTWAPTLRLGTAIIPVYTRGPATLAQQTAALADAAPGRVMLGLGASSNVIVERWNGLVFDRPYQRVRDTVRFLRAALTGEKVVTDFETFRVNGFRLTKVPEVQPRIMVAALRERMLALAGREADGAILNWLSAEDVTKVAPIVQQAGASTGDGRPREIVCRIFVCPSEDIDAVRTMAKRAMAAYLNVPVYKAFHQWLGRDALNDMWTRWEAGDRAGALEAIPNEVVDELYVHGSPTECRKKIQRYVDNGVTTTCPMITPLGQDIMQIVRDLSPSAG